MTTSISAGTAQIFQFPPRGRFALNARDDTKTVNLQPALAARVVSSSWYHDAAVQEAEHSRNN